MKLPVISGLEMLRVDACPVLDGRRVGLLAHPASVDSVLRPAADLLAADPKIDLRCLFGPQHGFRGETQDNMIEWDSYRDPRLGIPVHSLYGEHRKPTPESLEGLDALVIDLQDVGARYYTFIWTMLHCLEACADAGVAVVVLDRPNPIGGRREGAVLDPAFTSFVGLAPIPMRHGLTVGELARFFVAHFELDVDVVVVEMRGWSPSMDFDDCGLPWILPSPNMPTLETAFVYPGACLLEGTNLSEGRGTTRPFEILGAPWIDGEELAAEVRGEHLPGAVLRPLHFEPTFQKHAGRLCGGVQVHVTDRGAFEPVACYVAIMSAVRRLWPDDFAWKQPPYEYELDRLPIDILAGGSALREAVDAGLPLAEITAGWEAGCAAFAETTRPFRSYG